MSKSFTFTNREDAHNFAHGQAVDSEWVLDQSDSGEFIVTVFDYGTGFALSEIEAECGVTLQSVSQMASLAHLTDDCGVVFPVNTSAALCSATARFLLAKTAKFVGLNQLGHPVYKEA